MKVAEFSTLVHNVTRQGRNKYVATCPACQRYTLSFGDGKSGLILMCYFGCDAKHIMAALNLTLADLLHNPAAFRGSK
jgi:hypothetical protein